MDEELVEVAGDALRGDAERGHAQSGNVPGRLVEQQHLLDLEADRDFALTGRLFRLGPLALGLRAQGHDAVAQIAGQLGQEPHFLVPECIDLRGVDRQSAEGLALGHEGNGDDRGVAAPERVLAPWRQPGIRGDVLRDLDLARPDAGPRRPAAALGVGPGDVRRLQVPFVEPRLRDGPHGSGGILFRIADPAEPIPCFLDDDLAYLPEQRRTRRWRGPGPRCTC